MVGIPQQDKGCQRCRRMKKGCDRARPSCANCRRLGATCLYTAKQWTFVTSTRESSASSSRSSSSEPQNVLLPDSLANTAKSVAIIDELWSIYLPKDTSAAFLIDRKGSVPWMQTVQRYAEDESLRALAYLVVGDARHDQQYIDHSQRLYAAGLRKVNRALQNPDQMDITTAMATIKALSMYERMRKSHTGTPMTQAANWRRHIQGICDLIRFRGSKLRDVQGGDDLAENVHLNAIIINFMVRKPDLNVFAKQMLSSEPALRSQLLRLLDAVPDSLCMYDQVKAMIRLSRKQPDSSLLALQEGEILLSKLSNLLHSLKSWEYSMLAEFNARRLLSGLPESSLIECCTDFGFGLFYTVTLYWTTNVVVLVTAEACRKIMDTFAGKSMQAFCPLPLEHNSRYYAAAVARYASHFFTSEAGEWGAEAATFPFGVVNRYLWATGLDKAPEMRQLHDATVSNGHTYTFLKSVTATLPRPVSDLAEAESHRKMAKQWYGLTLDEEI